MTKIVDFESRRQEHLFKQKEAKVDALRKAFRQARGEPDPNSPRGKQKKRKDSKKK
ncbi:MAG: hypothetical protein OXU66_15395 [Gammaproteobacteria bacterium]|nr:hypothetical protein [Gammaproteobacteria bacterium]MDD9895892.1 hypothetical protein [Gammaproteobacteria bacterium]MDD9960302.1 hypothetical protein [Gammaproteobacteria bacterium]